MVCLVCSRCHVANVHELQRQPMLRTRSFFCTSQAVTAERDALLDEVQTLRQQAHADSLSTAMIALPFGGRKVSSRAARSILSFLQIAVLIGYFIWQDTAGH